MRGTHTPLITDSVRSELARCASVWSVSPDATGDPPILAPDNRIADARAAAASDRQYYADARDGELASLDWKSACKSHASDVGYNACTLLTRKFQFAIVTIRLSPRRPESGHVPFRNRQPYLFCHMNEKI